MKPDLRDSFTEHFFEWPRQLPELMHFTSSQGEVANVYICPQLLNSKRRDKSNVKACPNAWADLDSCDPSELLVEPSLLVQSSPGRWQAYWVFDEAIDPAEAEAISRRIAYMHAHQGADRSGWDLTQLLRVPGTLNFKYEVGTRVQTVEVNRVRYRPSDLTTKYPPVKSEKKEELPFPEEGKIVGITGEGLLDKYARLLPPQADAHFTDVIGDDWSKALWNLEMLAFEAGMSREEAFVFVRDAACNKYRRDNPSDFHRADALLWRDICRAWVRYEEMLTVSVPEEWEMPDLLTPDERRLIQGRQTFIEEYIAWAKTLGDAAPQYHEAGGFIVLSTMLGGAVRLPTGFGMIKPNLWFMILADTTLTRKSTAMDIAIELIETVDTESILATDGSIEGLMMGLSTRPGQPSIFLRDEFSGLLEALTKKDYYAGMAETLTKLYDGKLQKRVLKREIIEVKDPVFIMFAGGILKKVAGLLTDEHISSGFVPRFVFITAESDVDRVKPLGPPTERSTAGREVLTEKLRELRAHYSTSAQTVIREGRIVIESPQICEASLTEETWLRYNQLEEEMMRTALRSEQPQLLTPTYDRLCKSALKAAILIAASEMRKPAEEGVTVEIGDLLSAISYLEGWRRHTNLIIKNVGKGHQERELENVYQAIVRKPGITRGSLMQTYHMTARTANVIFQTLEQRGQITVQRSGRGERYFATQYQRSRKRGVVDEGERITVTMTEEVS